MGPGLAEAGPHVAPRPCPLALSSPAPGASWASLRTPAPPEGVLAPGYRWALGALACGRLSWRQPWSPEAPGVHRVLTAPSPGAPGPRASACLGAGGPQGPRTSGHTAVPRPPQADPAAPGAPGRSAPPFPAQGILTPAPAQALLLQEALHALPSCPRPLQGPFACPGAQRSTPELPLAMPFQLSPAVPTVLLSFPTAPESSRPPAPHRPAASVPMAVSATIELMTSREAQP